MGNVTTHLNNFSKKNMFEVQNGEQLIQKNCLLYTC